MWRAPLLLDARVIGALVPLASPEPLRRREPSLALLRAGRALGVRLGSTFNRILAAADEAEEASALLIKKNDPEEVYRLTSEKNKLAGREPEDSKTRDDGLEIGEGGALAYDGNKEFSPINYNNNNKRHKNNGGNGGREENTQQVPSRETSEKSFAKAAAKRSASRFLGGGGGEGT